MKISVIIHTYNAEASLESVLKSLLDYDEIIICDMYSTDRTIEIGEKYNCRIIYHKNVGYADPARQFSVSHATHDWILMVDADECIPACLRNYIKETIEKNPNISAIRFPRKNYFMGRFMHSFYPDYITRLFKKDKVFWSGEIHTRPEITGEIYLVPRNLKDVAFIHNGTPSISYMIDKTNTYTDIEIRRWKKRSNGYFTIMLSPFSRFFKCYIMRGGIRDGIPGLIRAIDAAIYKFYALAKTAESKVKVDDYDPEFLSYFEEDIRRVEKEMENKKQISDGYIRKI